MNTIKRNFAALDGMRGIAAILVVLSHVPQFFVSSRYHAGEEFLAVDLFFVLSGAVIAHNYAHRLNSSMTVMEFMKVRLIRLYPLYLLGILIAVCAAVITHEYVPIKQLQFLGLALLYLPYVGSASTVYFPLNEAAWSLFQELLANVVYAYSCRKRIILSASVVIIGGSFLGLVLTNHVKSSLNLGWGPLGWHKIDMGMIGGLSRVGFSLFAGVMVYKLYTKFNSVQHLDRVYSLLLLLIVGATLFITPSLKYREAYDLIAVVVVFPTVVYFGMVYQPVGMLGSVCRFLGVTSYAIYCIHLPIANLITRLGLHPNGYVFIVAIVVTSWLIDRVYDIPVRRWINLKFKSRLNMLRSVEA